MDSTKIYKKGILSIILLTILVISGCKVSYKLTGASIDYTKVKTISMESFQNRAAYQWGPMAQMFNQTLNDVFVQQTKLVQVKNGGDLHLAGEITAYDQFNKSISSDGYSSMVQLKMTVNVRFTNNTNHDEDFERTFSAVRDFEASQSLESVQEELVTQMIKEIVESIFNAAVANW
ncbi:MAG: LptE family protein [Bacteroidaceae bacterium]|nr:LptE family protein [Bacteroidaceae bacterium]MBR5277272.1 LptE family protein [Bacteroidaceae bacterium]MBR5890427.1 LptE family protein [Bacteroidaceae bacterium]